MPSTVATSTAIVGQTGLAVLMTTDHGPKGFNVQQPCTGDISDRRRPGRPAVIAG
nr:hypothetical protein [Kibdelosporangium sp. MJ126-NF4]CTQ97491.1 hypothetical protein [Kibdelosporangium sp. MJ126-NF4]